MKLPKGWKIRQVEDLVTIREGQVSPLKDPYRTQLHVGPENISSGGGLRPGLQSCEELGLKSGKYRFTPGAIIYSKIRPNLNKVCLVEFEGVCSADAYPLYAKSDITVSDFLIHALRGPRFLQQAIAVSVRSGMPKINREDLNCIELPIPPVPEQRKIADILSTWDEALETLDALIAAKDRQKKALMQQLLSRSSLHATKGHARHRLGEVCERVTRKNGVTSENVLTISAQGGLVNQRDYFNRSVAGADLSGYYLLKRGEFAYNRSSAKGYPYGAIKRLDQYDCGVVSTLYLCFCIRAKAQVDSNYLSQYFEAGRLNSGLRSVAKEGARAHGLLNVTADEFFDIDIFLPTLAEQQQIATILDTADQELTLLRTQRQTIDQQKRGLMHRLLTGKIRVKV